MMGSRHERRGSVGRHGKGVSVRLGEESRLSLERGGVCAAERERFTSCFKGGTNIGGRAALLRFETGDRPGLVCAASFIVMAPFGESANDRLILV